MSAGSDLKILNQWKSFGGQVIQATHKSSSLGGLDARFSIYLPPQYKEDAKLPILFWLSGLTCSDENFVQKSGAHEHAARLGIAFVAPDTSPRGAGVPGETDSWDFGVGAGFYLDATEPQWAAHYRMYSYITEELPAFLPHHYPGLDFKNVSVSGHSMGGHGALTIALKNAGSFRSVSAFSPITHPSVVPWGIKAFTGYLGEDKSTWSKYDATELVKSLTEVPNLPILVDQGTADKFLPQLLPQDFLDAAQAKGISVDYRSREGYDHSYFYIATFIGEHFDFHAKYLIAQE